MEAGQYPDDVRCDLEKVLLEMSKKNWLRRVFHPFVVKKTMRLCPLFPQSNKPFINRFTHSFDL
jgi:hypothetical protein